MSREKGRVVKPEIPGPGGSVCCTTEPVLATLVDLRAKNKRLEAVYAAKDRALRAELDHWRAALTAWRGNDTIDIAYASGLAAETRLTAALSPSAGEGWVPPGLVEEAMNALEWNSDIIIEVLEKSEPAGKGWYKVPPGVLSHPIHRLLPPAR